MAIDVLAQKYFRKAGVPARLKPVREKGVPNWLCRRVADEAALAGLPEAERYGSETSAAQVFDRLAGTWTYWGWKNGYFDSEADARTFHDELRYMLAAQMAAPNSPQWFNTGLNWAYGITGPAQVAYLDATGSGAETIAHLRENGRLVIMCCAFEGAPRIVRLHGRAEVHAPGSAGFEPGPGRSF